MERRSECIFSLTLVTELVRVVCIAVIFMRPGPLQAVIAAVTTLQMLWQIRIVVLAKPTAQAGLAIYCTFRRQTGQKRHLLVSFKLLK